MVLTHTVLGRCVMEVHRHLRHEMATAHLRQWVGPTVSLLRLRRWVTAMEGLPRPQWAMAATTEAGTKVHAAIVLCLTQTARRCSSVVKRWSLVSLVTPPFAAV